MKHPDRSRRSVRAPLAGGFSALLLLVLAGCASGPGATVPVAADVKTFTVSGLGLTMIRLAPGAFTLGHPGGNGAEPDETARLRVTLTQAYWLGATEVTVGQWRQFAEATGHKTRPETTGEGIWGWVGAPNYYEKQPGTSWRNPERVAVTDDRQPVAGVNWDDAQAFCAWLTQRERAAGRLPVGYVYALPSEAQWEYAAKAGSELGDPLQPDEVAWHGGNSGMKPHPVAQKQPNAWGFYDMVGNLWEWCQDWYGGPFPGGSATDFVGAEPTGGAQKIHNIRGNSYTGTGVHNTSFTNRWGTSDNREGYRVTLGFRVALVAAPAAK